MFRKMLSVSLGVLLVGALAISAYAAPPSREKYLMDSPSGDGSGPLEGSLTTNAQGIMITTLAPVEIPGRVLAAGTYDFLLVNDDQAVEVLNAATSEAYGTFFVLPTSRKTATGQAEVDLNEAPGGGVRRITAWYFPNQVEGFAFAYPKAKRGPIVLAQASK